jgi:hypothetical protein
MNVEEGKTVILAHEQNVFLIICQQMIPLEKSDTHQAPIGQ